LEDDGDRSEEQRMDGVTVVSVETRRDLQEFIGLPYRLYRGDPLWVPPLRRDVAATLSAKKNPFFHHAEARYFLARRAKSVVGRVAAVHNRAHNEFHDDKVGFFGFFECVDDDEVARPLLAAAADWLRARGLEVMRGPASFSTNDEVGLLVDGFETPPALMMPFNPPRYGTHIERAGFAKAKDLLVYQSTPAHVDMQGPLVRRLQQRASILARRYGITIRTLDMKRFDDDLMLIKEVYNQAWERNWGFVPMDEREIDHLAAQLKPIIVPDLVPFAMRGGRPIGFAVALPDLNVALKANPSGRLFPGLIKIMWAARRITRVRILLLGVLPEWRKRGLDALLYKELWERGYARGYRWGEAGWILEDNTSMNNALTRMGFEVYKTYRLYDGPL
jgi:GNAT superfamily N-acetyltransferase